MKYSLSKLHFISLIILALVLATGVVFTSFSNSNAQEKNNKKPNTRWFEKGNAVFWADLYEKAPNNYYVFEFGTPENPYDGSCPIYNDKE